MNADRVGGILQTRIGQLVSQYETDIAILRDKHVEEVQQLKDQISDLQEKLNDLDGEKKGQDVKQKAQPAN